MDLCCFLGKDAPVKTATELVELLGTLIQQGGSPVSTREIEAADPLDLCIETDYHVKMLPRARIPIIKLSMPPSEASPFGMACDIGFENRLALENTRLLLNYAKIDERLRTMVLFRTSIFKQHLLYTTGLILFGNVVKVWTKRRQINNPYMGTLSSYGYVLLVIYFLEHVKDPPVLP